MSNLEKPQQKREAKDFHLDSLGIVIKTSHAAKTTASKKLPSGEQTRGTLAPSQLIGSLEVLHIIIGMEGHMTWFDQKLCSTRHTGAQCPTKK